MGCGASKGQPPRELEPTRVEPDSPERREPESVPDPVPELVLEQQVDVEPAPKLPQPESFEPDSEPVPGTLPEPESQAAEPAHGEEDDSGFARQQMASLSDIEELEVMLTICAGLSPKDLGRLACTTASFGRPVEWPGDELTKYSEPRSVVQEWARRWVLARSWKLQHLRQRDDRELEALLQKHAAEMKAYNQNSGAQQQQPLEVQTTGRNEESSWLRRMHEIQTPKFVEAHERIALSKDGSVASIIRSCGRDSERYPTAVSALLAGGKHYAVFTPQRGCGYIGLLESYFDVRAADKPVFRCWGCFLDLGDGGRWYVGNGCKYRWWPGISRAAFGDGDRVGLLFDTSSGSLTVFKNDARVGVMLTGRVLGDNGRSLDLGDNGLRDTRYPRYGYRWAVCKPGDHVRIEGAGSSPLPPSPTQEELVAAAREQWAHDRADSDDDGRFGSG